MVVNELGDSVTDSSPGWDECHLLRCGLVSTSSDEPAKRDQWNGYSHGVCFLAERPGSGDGEREASMTRQMPFEPLPASVLFALGWLWWLHVAFFGGIGDSGGDLGSDSTSHGSSMRHQYSSRLVGFVCSKIAMRPSS